MAELVPVLLSIAQTLLNFIFISAMTDKQKSNTIADMRELIKTVREDLLSEIKENKTDLLNQVKENAAEIQGAIKDIEKNLLRQSGQQ